MANISTSDSQVTVCRLYVKRDNTTSGRGMWRLAWMENDDSTSYISAEGECSAKLFRTRTAAIAYGERVYGERARHWPR